MNSDEPLQAPFWSTSASFTGQPTEPWFLRSTSRPEPRADLIAECWLRVYSVSSGSGDVYVTSDLCNTIYSDYLCSSNEWAAATPPPRPPPALPPRPPPALPPLPRPPPYAPGVVYDSCAGWCSLGGKCDASATRAVRLGGEVREVTCVCHSAPSLGFSTHCIDTIRVNASTSGVPAPVRITDPNACPAGTAVWFPRSLPQLLAVDDVWESAARHVGIYSDHMGCGGCTKWPMNSGWPAQAAHWTSTGNLTGQPATPWYLRDQTSGAVDGGTYPGCWLRVGGKYNTGYYVADERCTEAFDEVHFCVHFPYISPPTLP